jgi:hypothetical protein
LVSWNAIGWSVVVQIGGQITAISQLGATGEEDYVSPVI